MILALKKIEALVEQIRKMKLKLVLKLDRSCKQVKKAVCD